MHLDATEHGDKLIFLHTVKEGPANQSYGLQVAALAGVPPKVITAARRYLRELEIGARLGARAAAATGAGAGFRAGSRPRTRDRGVEEASIPDAMTPREALDGAV